MGRACWISTRTRAVWAFQHGRYSRIDSEPSPQNRTNHSCVARRPTHTPLFDETISCLALIMGESGCSKHGLGLDRSRVSTFFSVGYPLDDRVPVQIRDQG